MSGPAPCFHVGGVFVCLFFVCLFCFVFIFIFWQNGDSVLGTLSPCPVWYCYVRRHISCVFWLPILWNSPNTEYYSNKKGTEAATQPFLGGGVFFFWWHSWKPLTVVYVLNGLLSSDVRYRRDECKTSLFGFLLSWSQPSLESLASMLMEGGWPFLHILQSCVSGEPGSGFPWLGVFLEHTRCFLGAQETGPLCVHGPACWFSWRKQMLLMRTLGALHLICSPGVCISNK